VKAEIVLLLLKIKQNVCCELNKYYINLDPIK